MCPSVKINSDWAEQAVMLLHVLQYWTSKRKYKSQTCIRHYSVEAFARRCAVRPRPRQAEGRTESHSRAPAQNPRFARSTQSRQLKSGSRAQMHDNKPQTRGTAGRKLLPPQLVPPLVREWPHATMSESATAPAQPLRSPLRHLRLAPPQILRPGQAALAATSFRRPATRSDKQIRALHHVASFKFFGCNFHRR